MNQTLPQSEHLKRQRDFKSVISKGNSKKLDYAKIYGHSKRDGQSKIGLIVGKKVGIAPYRNRVKRLWKEAFRLVRQDFQQPMDLVVKIYPNYRLKHLDDLKHSIMELEKC